MNRTFTAMDAAIMTSECADLRSTMLPGTHTVDTFHPDPALHLVLQEPAGGQGKPVLYVHGATFPAANSVLFRFEGTSWADALNREGFSVWGFDFAGFGDSARYESMSASQPPTGEPLGRAPEAARQIERVVRRIIAETGVQRVPIVAHSWGSIAAGLFAGQHPELVDRLVFFGPVVQRTQLGGIPPLGPWRFLTVAEQHARFVEDVPDGHPPVLVERDFPAWAERYLDADPDSRSRTPHSVKTPNGPLADITAAWSGHLAYDPALITAPLAIIRGEWDHLSTDADVAWLRSHVTQVPEFIDVKVPKATHLMHLEQSRHRLYEATSAFLKLEG